MSETAKKKPETSELEHLEYDVPAPMFAEMLALIGELPGRMTWKILAHASTMRPRPKRNT